MKTYGKRTDWLWLLLPVLPLVYSFYLLMDDAVVFLLWWIAHLLLGLLIWPLAAKLFPLGDRGYLAAKPISLLIFSFPLWLLAHTGLPVLNIVVLYSLIAGLGCVFWLTPFFRKSLITPIREQSFLHHLSSVETRNNLLRRVSGGEFLFASVLLVWTFARGLKPELDSLEKFMNIGFMNSLWRAETLPAQDMWFAGNNINYYYFGHYVYTWMAKLVQIRPESAYNLAMASTFALTASTGYTVVNHALAGLVKTGRRIWKWAPAAGGLIASLLISVGGNSHAFFFYEKGIGNSVLGWLKRTGLLQPDRDKTFWFADSTRFIGYDPATTDKTIHEFPFYSFLVADLHAHVINLAFVLLLLLTILYYIRQDKNQPDSIQTILKDKINSLSSNAKAGQTEAQIWHQQASKLVRVHTLNLTKQPHMLLTGLLLAVFMMCNFWDFAIYIVFLSLLLLYANTRDTRRLLSRSGLFVLLLQAGSVMCVFLFVSQPLLALAAYLIIFIISQYLTILADEGITRTGAQISWLFFLSHLLALPFNLAFEPISKAISLVENRTPFWQLLILWGTHILTGMVIFIAGWLLLRTRMKKHKLPFSRLDQYLAANRTADSSQSRLVKLISVLEPTDVFFLAAFICGIGLLLVPELIYVVDIYSGDFKRANTMFKFTYQAFILLGAVWAYGLARLALHKPVWQPSGKTLTKQVIFSARDKLICRTASLLLILLLILPMTYPLPATRQWLGAFKTERYRGVNGLKPMQTKQSAQINAGYNQLMAADYAAINWLNQEVTGQPVILESHGESYTDFCRISAFTGLPTVMGWETHQWLWRTSSETPNAYGDIVLPRQNDVERIYLTEDQDYRINLIQQYKIEYIIVGNLERTRFSQTADNTNNEVDDEDGQTSEDESTPPVSLINEQGLKALGSIVFSYDDLYIIKVNSQ